MHAYLDAVSDNKPDPGGDPITNGSFLTAANLAQPPTTADNREVAVQNLFYLNNVIHDTLYDAGFVEAAGNFQENNFSTKQGESDSVNAEAQDGGGIDNANFATPPDGVNPRMQMYLWTGLGTHEVVVHASGGDVSYLAQGALWGAQLNTTGVTGVLAVAVDGTAPVNNACEALVGDYAGKIVVADRGACDFTVKAKNVQNAGGVGIIVANNNGSAPFPMGGRGRQRHDPRRHGLADRRGRDQGSRGHQHHDQAQRRAAADARRRPRLRHRVARVRSRPDLADDRQDERRPRRCHRRGHEPTYWR